MILPLFLWITRQKAARERRGGIGCGSGRDSVATPDRRGQGRAVAGRISPVRPPLGPPLRNGELRAPRTPAKARESPRLSVRRRRPPPYPW